MFASNVALAAFSAANATLEANRAVDGVDGTWMAPCGA
jgi:hypothetical protein